MGLFRGAGVSYAKCKKGERSDLTGCEPVSGQRGEGAPDFDRRQEIKTAQKDLKGSVLDVDRRLDTKLWKTFKKNGDLTPKDLDEAFDDRFENHQRARASVEQALGQFNETLTRARDTQRNRDLGEVGRKAAGEFTRGVGALGKTSTPTKEQAGQLLNQINSQVGGDEDAFVSTVSRGVEQILESDPAAWRRAGKAVTDALGPTPAGKRITDRIHDLELARSKRFGARTYGRGEPCKQGEAAARSGCIPATKGQDAVSGQGAGGGIGAIEGLGSAQIAQAAEVAQKVFDTVEAGGEFSPKDRRATESLLGTIGMDPKQAGRWIDAIAGKPEVATRARRFASQKFGKMKAGGSAATAKAAQLLEASGVPKPLAKPVASTAGLLFGTPVNITSGLAITGVIDAWGFGITGQMEGAALVGAFMLGGAAVKAVRSISQRTKNTQILADEGAGRPFDDSPESVLTLAKSVQESMPKDPMRRRAYMKLLQLNAIAVDEYNPRTFAAAAARMAEMATPDEVKALAA